ncbi:MAG: PIN domain-containing protein [Terracidiphilus sp.]
MKYLLDVNALIAFGVTQHQFHQRVVDWIRSERGSTFLTSSVTEIGFVRVVASVAMYGLKVPQARVLLLGMKANAAQPLTFLPDANDISALPAWVKSPGQTTDGHLVQLAIANGAVLATLDEGISGAFVIP